MLPLLLPLLLRLLQPVAVATAAAAVVIFFLAPLVAVETRRRNPTPFLGLMTASLAIAIAECAFLIVRNHGMPPIADLAAVLAYILGLVLQLDRLGLGTGKGRDEERPAWQAYVGAWIAMALADALALVLLLLRARDARLDLVVHGVALGLRILVNLALLACFLLSSRLGYIRLEDDPESEAASSDESRMAASVRDEISAAGGRWKWAVKFLIFLPWLWPSDRLGMKLVVVASLLLKLANTGLTLYLPQVNAGFMETAVRAFADGNMDPVWPALAKLLLLRFVTSNNGLPCFSGLLWQRFRQFREHRARVRVHAHLMLNEASFYDVADQTDVNMAANMCLYVCHALDFLVLDTVPQVITFVGACGTIVSLYGPHVAVVQLMAVLLHTLVLLRTGRLLMPLIDERLTAVRDTERRRSAGVRGWRTVVLHGQEENEVGVFGANLARQQRIKWKSYLLQLVLDQVSSLVSSLGTYAVTALVIAYGIRSGKSVGFLVSSEGYATLLSGPMHFFSSLYDRVFDDMLMADRLRRLLEFQPTMTYGDEQLQLARGRIELKDVWFAYPCAKGKAQKWVFKGLNLVMEPGRCTALVGPSGAGKTTVLDLIARFYDPDRGAVEIDGQDIRKLRRGELAANVAVMAQTPHLFSDTIANNIQYGHTSATDDDAMHEAAKKANIHDVIMERDDQYKTVVGETKGKFSGGEKQRIALARTIMRNVPVLLVDEGTSALDADSEAHVKKSIQASFSDQKKTVVLIAHRLSSIMHADNIIVFTKGQDGCGEIGEQGTHDELLAKDGIYARLWRKHIGADDTSIEDLFE